MPAVSQHCDESQRWEQVDGGEESTTNARSFEGYRPDVVGLLAQFFELHTLGTETLHDSNTGHALFHHAGQLCLLVLYCKHRGMDTTGESS